ncbi:MAG: hypothetical protein K2X35_10780 [Bryobacteraceae bacterium]|nr:hypothetical protein [Bryobacteraceae bacterium]
MAKPKAPARAPAGPSGLKQRIVQRYFLRFHMGLILAATIGSGVVASKVLLLAGVHSLVFRYPLAVLLSFGAFLGMIRVWIWYVHARPSWNPGSAADGLSDVAVDLAAESGARAFVPGGGASGGGGASDMWEAGPTAGNSGSWMPDVDVDLDFDGEGALVLAVLALLMLAIFGAGVYLVWLAPEILAEAAVSVILAGSLAKTSRRMDREGWMGGVLRRTWIPLVLVTMLSGVFGWVCRQACPEAGKLADVLACISQ